MSSKRVLTSPERARSYCQHGTRTNPRSRINVVATRLCRLCSAGSPHFRRPQDVAALRDLPRRGRTSFDEHFSQPADACRDVWQHPLTFTAA